MTKSQTVERPERAAASLDLVIDHRGRSGGYWRELWRYRELFFFLAWRDILVRYKQTVIGLLWALLRPLLTMVVFTVVFGRIAKLPSEGEAPYAVMVYAALLPWQLFAGALADSGNSLVGNAGLITKVYFPRLAIPTATIAVSVVDFLISFVVLIVLMLGYGFMPTWRIVAVPLFLVLTVTTTYGFGVLIAAFNVRYRDFRHAIPFLVQFGLFVSPVAFSSAVIPEQWRDLYALNPMVGVIDGFRWAILGSELAVSRFAISAGAAVIVTVVGLWYFRRTERSFADVI